MDIDAKITKPLHLYRLIIIDFSVSQVFWWIKTYFTSNNIDFSLERYY